jgi:hypothetical protein
MVLPDRPCSAGHVVGCGGVWVDRRRLTRVIAAHILERIPDIAAPHSGAPRGALWLPVSSEYPPLYHKYSFSSYYVTIVKT